MELEILRGHVSQETAVLVEDYPYGRLRCKIRYWVERPTKGAGKGQERPVSQTSNPKTGNTWQNKPKAGTYCDRVYLYRDNRNGHIRFAHVSINGPDYLARFIVQGFYAQLTEEERADLQTLIDADQKYNRRSWTRYRTNLARIREAGFRYGLDNPELRTLGGFSGTIAEEDGGMYESDFDLLLAQIKAEDRQEYKLPEID